MSNIFRERLTLLREMRGLTGNDLAQLAGGRMKPSTISLLEGGKRINPYASTIVQLAKALETSADYLLGLTDDPTQVTAKEVDPRLQAIMNAWRKLSDADKDYVRDFVALLAKRQKK